MIKRRYFRQDHGDNSGSSSSSSSSSGCDSDRDSAEEAVSSEEVEEVQEEKAVREESGEEEEEELEQQIEEESEYKCITTYHGVGRDLLHVFFSVSLSRNCLVFLQMDSLMWLDEFKVFNLSTLICRCQGEDPSDFQVVKCNDQSVHCLFDC
jgi:hypothetical protein